MKNLLTIACAVFIAFAGIESLSAKSKENPSAKAKTENKSNAKVKKIRHIVCFKFKEDAEPATIRKVEQEFAALKGKISGIRSLEWGKNNSPEGLNKGFTHCFIVTFENEKARTAYLPHPDHKAFVSILKPILEDVFVIDFNP
ncbi:MAG: Dabb family protein [Opitutales bacterium]